MDPIIFSLKEYYLWRKNTETQVPWKRQYLNQEFLNYEQKRIRDLVEWRHGFYKAENGQILKEISFYSVPVELNTFWKGAIAEEGKYNYVGLSGLQNSPAILTIGLIPYYMKQPPEYNLILITKSKKSFIHNKSHNLIYEVIIIEEWESLDSDKIYVDVPHEKNNIQKLIKENLIGEENLSLAFQSPLIGSPYVQGSMGGISLSSMSMNGPFSRELIKTILKMTPPEYRGLEPPRIAYLGGKVSDVDGISFHFAERPYFDNKCISSFYDDSLSRLKNEITKRSKFKGEYSIFSSITPRYSGYTSIWNDLLKSFTETEITLPNNLEDLPKADVDLTRLNKSINEDLWIQIVASKQLNPPINKEEFLLLDNTMDRLRKDFDAILSGVHKEDLQKEMIVRSMIYNTTDNVKRLTQSFARAEDRDILNEFDFSKARDLIVDNFNDFVEHPNFDRIQFSLKRRTNDLRFSVIQTTLINNSKSTIHEIYESVKSTKLFKDLTDLQGLLDWVQKKGFVWVDKDKKYEWI